MVLSLSFPTPPYFVSTPSASLPKITNADFSDRDAVQRLADAWDKSDACKRLNDRLNSESPKAVPSRQSASWVAGLTQLKVLIVRATINSIRDPGVYAFRLVLYVFMSLFLGSV